MARITKGPQEPPLIVSLVRRRATNRFPLALSEVENLTKKLLHSPLLDTRLVIANSATRLVGYHLVSNAGSWNNRQIISLEGQTF